MAKRFRFPLTPFLHLYEHNKKQKEYALSIFIRSLNELQSEEQSVHQERKKTRSPSPGIIDSWRLQYESFYLQGLSLRLESIGEKKKDIMRNISECQIDYSHAKARLKQMENLLETKKREHQKKVSEYFQRNLDDSLSPYCLKEQQ